MIQIKQGFGKQVLSADEPGRWPSTVKTLKRRFTASVRNGGEATSHVVLMQAVRAV